jgi:hypothetical protein
MSSAVQLGTAVYFGYTMLRLQAPVVGIVVTVALTALASSNLSSGLQSFLKPENLDLKSKKIWNKTELPCELVASTAVWKLAQLALAYLTKVAPPAIPKLLLIAASISALAIAYYRFSAMATNKKHSDAINKLNIEHKPSITIEQKNSYQENHLENKLKKDFQPYAEFLTEELGTTCIVQQPWLGTQSGNIYIAIQNKDLSEERIAACNVTLTKNDDLTGWGSPPMLKLQYHSFTQVFPQRSIFNL